MRGCHGARLAAESSAHTSDVSNQLRRCGASTALPAAAPGGSGATAVVSAARHPRSPRAEAPRCCTSGDVSAPGACAAHGDAHAARVCNTCRAGACAPARLMCRSRQPHRGTGHGRVPGTPGASPVARARHDRGTRQAQRWRRRRSAQRRHSFRRARGRPARLRGGVAAPYPAARGNSTGAAGVLSIQLSEVAIALSRRKHRTTTNLEAADMVRHPLQAFRVGRPGVPWHAARHRSRRCAAKARAVALEQVLGRSMADPCSASPPHRPPGITTEHVLLSAAASAGGGAR